MGVDSCGILISPKGKKLLRVPLGIARRIQIVQHWIAQMTWR